MTTEKCSKCWSKDIVFHEYMWAFDGCLVVNCKKCNIAIHRASWKEILKLEQKETYGPVMFFLEGGDVYVNNRLIWNEAQ